MKIRIILFLFISTFILFSCQSTNYETPLNIDINQVESVRIYNIYGHFKDYGLVERDTTIMIDKKDWKPLIDNFNQAESLGLTKSAVYYSIIIKLKNEEEIKVQFAEDDAFKLESDESYAFTKENIEILNRYYETVPFLNQ